MLVTVNNNGSLSVPAERPAIDPVSGNTPRPLWSVMIPTFNCARYLRQTLESVLAQDPGVDQMQIEVVDDCSTQDDPEAIVRQFGRARVSFHRKSANEGAIANFNTCLQRSRGHLVHILHGDDYVLPGFYDRLAETAKLHPTVAGLFVRSFVVDEKGELEGMSERIPQLKKPSHVPGDLLYINELRTPGVVVRRSFYEKEGGFMPSLVHVADWEMWIRVIRLGGGLWLNEPLAAYRFFPGNDTGRLARTAENLRDYLRLAKIFESQFPDFDRLRCRALIAHRAELQRRHFQQIGDPEAARANELLWRELVSPPKRWAKKVLAGLRSFAS